MGEGVLTKIRFDDPAHYDLVKTLSYAADINFIIGAPNRGKTFTTRAYCLHRYIDKKMRFVEVCRTKTLKKDIKGGYFDKLSKFEQFAGYEYKCVGSRFMTRPLDGDRKSWEVCGYIIALTELQSVKESTFVDVENVIFDEAIIEKIDRHHSYMPREWDLVARVVDSCVREQVGQEIKPKLFMLGNAVDILNPHFQALGITKEPKRGYSWHYGKTVLVHYIEQSEADRERLKSTLAGRMGAVTGYTERTYNNRFEVDERFIAKKTEAARFVFAVRYNGVLYGIWIDYDAGFYFVTSKVPKDAKQIYSLTRDDGTVSTIAARRTTRALQSVVDMYYAGGVLYESVAVREGFLDAMRLFGIR